MHTKEDCLKNSSLFYIKITNGLAGKVWRIQMSGKKVDEEKHRSERIEETGQVTLDKNGKSHTIHLISVIGEVEGHDNLGSNSKTTKYEHVLPELAAIEDSKDIDGVLILLNTMGGDVEAGLAIAEMIASLSKPTVSLVLGEVIQSAYPLR